MIGRELPCADHFPLKARQLAILAADMDFGAIEALEISITYVVDFYQEQCANFILTN